MATSLNQEKELSDLVKDSYPELIFHPISCTLLPPTDYHLTSWLGPATVARVLNTKQHDFCGRMLQNMITTAINTLSPGVDIAMLTFERPSGLVCVYLPQFKAYEFKLSII